MKDFLLSKGLLPDLLIRWKIRSLLKQRLQEEKDKDPSILIAELKQSPIAIETGAANEQHYEVPTAFYKHCLGRRLKYSSCYFEPGDSLDKAEERMLEIYAERAQLRDGQRILELGCGWGSLTLWLAEKYPNSRITAISNSTTQRSYILKEAQARGLENILVITTDINYFQCIETFDRILSIEMFEHLRNYRELFHRISGWMKPDALMFVHIFTHHRFSYKFEVKDESDWMSKYFFTGGIMPSHNLFRSFQDDLSIVADWKVNGRHYGQTAACWLHNMDKSRSAIMPIFEECYGRSQAAKWFAYWRIFFMACEELWNYNNGEEWGVSHYLFRKK